ncbi:MAG: lytic transglycosylase [Magnetococcus sp. YQC-9]
MRGGFAKAGYRLLGGVMVCVGLAGCAGRSPAPTPLPAKKVNDACAIFQDRGGWYEETRKSAKKWGVPIPVQLAIIHQESGFRHDARPPQSKLFWFIPGGRASSAFGYAQALDETWENYQKNTGAHRASRDNFADAVDFVGWYVDLSHRKCGISKSDARLQYLAYHEGQQGYNRRTYEGKKWLLDTAHRVEKNAERYRQQLARCRPEEGSSGKRGWFF